MVDGEDLIKTFPWTPDQRRHLLTMTWCNSVTTATTPISKQKCFPSLFFIGGHQQDFVAAAVFFFSSCFWWLTGAQSTIHLSFWLVLVANPAFNHTDIETYLGNLRKRKENVNAIIFIKEPLLTSVKSGLKSGSVPISCGCPWVSFDTIAKWTFLYSLGGYTQKKKHTETLKLQKVTKWPATVPVQAPEGSLAVHCSLYTHQVLNKAL